MEDSIEVNILVDELYSEVIDIRSVMPTPLPSEIDAIFKSINHSFKGFQTAIETSNRNRTAYYGKSFASDVSKFSAFADRTNLLPPEVTNSILTKSKAITLATEQYYRISKVNDSFADNEMSIALRDTEEKIINLSLEQEKLAQRINKETALNETRLVELEKKIDELVDKADIEIQKITSAYSDGLSEIEIKKTEINDILGHVSGRAVAGDYENSAAEERKMADWLRAGSLFCMALIAASLGYSFWETISTEFNWQKSIFRITLTFLLSVPAAYLARESAKHREQQYQHLQTSLDLKAISPFMASLPEDEQHKIKIAIASKIFAGRDFSKVGSDPYPLNTHEIIIELIKRFDPAKASSKPNTDTADQK